MTPKPPIPPAPKINLPEMPVLHLPPLHGTGQSVIVRPGMRVDATVDFPAQPGTGQAPASPTLPALPPLTAQDTAISPSTPAWNDPLYIFRLSDFSARLLPEPNLRGFRVQGLRRYADVQHHGTVLVEFDVPQGVYRAKLRNEQVASGPALALNADNKTWRLAPIDQPARQLNAEPDVSRLEPPRGQKRPVDNEQPGPSQKRPLIEQPPVTRLPQTPPRLPDLQSSTDGDSPVYVEISRKNADERKNILEHLQVRMNLRGAQKNLEEVAASMKPYNLSNRQLTQMLTDIQANGSAPQWAEHHKLSSMDERNISRFDDAYEELLPEILSLRNTGQGYMDLNASYTRPYLDGLLAYAGYKRNRYNCLYRTDIPAMFRGDDRTPFEFARDGHLLPRQNLGEGSTSQQAVSTTFSLSDAQQYIRHFGNQSRIEELLYNTQYHQFPGNLDKTQLNVREGDSTTEAESDGAEDSYISDGEGESGRVNEKDYFPKRHNQNIAFCYLLDTRNIEVVPARENYHLNRDALEASNNAGGKTWFPDDDLEGHISVSSRGFAAERIWLVNSTFTRAARVADVYAQSYGHADLSSRGEADSIEERTWAGARNHNEYDDLIDEVAAANKPVINFPSGKEVFSNDIVFAPGLTPPTTR